MKQKKLGLSLRGGGARTVAYIGVLKALDEEGIHIDYITGCSAGAAIAVSYAAGVSLEKLACYFKNFTWPNYVGIDSVRRLYVASDKKLRRQLKNLVGDMDFDQTKIPVWTQATNLETGRLEYLHEGKLVDAAIASASAPMWMRPCKLNGKTYLDGGITTSYGVAFLKEMGAEVVFALGPSDEGFVRTGVFDRFLRPLFISIHYAASLDFALNPPDLFMGELGRDFKFLDFDKTDGLVMQGYRMAKERNKEIRELLY